MDIKRKLKSLFNNINSPFKHRDEFELTSGGIAAPLFYLSLPIVITNLFQTVYNLVDTFWLGRYSTNALAAISFSFPLVYFLISLGLGISIAGSVLVAQNIGNKTEKQAEYAASQTVVFAVITSLILGAIGYLFIEHIIALFGAAPDVVVLATEYMQVISLGLVFMYGFFIFISLMRGYGDTITPMLVMFGSVVLNLILDPFLIFGWGPFIELGVQGAAVATVFSRALAMFLGIWIMFRGNRGIEIHISQMIPNITYIKKIFIVGAPASIETVSRSLSVNLMLFIVGLFSTTVAAGFGIGIRVLSVIFMPAMAIAQGVETMTGQNIGAGKYDRAEKTNHFASKSMFLLLTTIGIITWLAAEPIVSIFTIDQAVVDVGAQFLRYVALTFGCMGVMRAYIGGFRGAGKTLTAAVISILTLEVVRLPIAWIIANLIGPPGIWISFAISNIFGASIATIWFLKGTWKTGDLTQKQNETTQNNNKKILTKLKNVKITISLSVFTLIISIIGFYISDINPTLFLEWFKIHPPNELTIGLFLGLFSHVTYLHLGINLISLIIYGCLAEKYLTIKEYLFLFLFSGYFSGLLQTWITQDLGAGISGSIMAIIGFYSIQYIYNNKILSNIKTKLYSEKRIRYIMAITGIIIILIVLIFLESKIAHITGTTIGILFLIYKKYTKPHKIK